MADVFPICGKGFSIGIIIAYFTDGKHHGSKVDVIIDYSLNWDSIIRQEGEKNEAGNL